MAKGRKGRQEPNEMRDESRTGGRRWVMRDVPQLGVCVKKEKSS